MSNYELKVIELLKKGGFFFQREKSFKDLKQGDFRFDFYVSDVDGAPALIEVDGEQHFISNPRFFKTRTAFLHQQNNDRRKNSYCLANKIALYRIPFWDVQSLDHPMDLFKEEYRVKSKWHNDDLWQKHKKIERKD